VTFSLSGPKENVTLDEYLLQCATTGSPLYDYQVFIFHTFNFFIMLSIFFFSFLSFSILCATRLLALDTPDLPRLSDRNIEVPIFRAVGEVYT